MRGHRHGVVGQCLDLHGMRGRQRLHKKLGQWKAQQAFLNVLSKNMLKNIFSIDTLFSLMFKEITGKKKGTYAQYILPENICLTHFKCFFRKKV